MESEKPNPSEIRDRLEALRRVPAYEKDYKEYLRLCECVKENARKPSTKPLEALKACEKKMRENWKVKDFPPLTDTPLEKWHRLRLISLATDLQPLKEISPFAATKQGIIGGLLDGYDPIRLEAVASSFNEKSGRGPLRYRGGKHLCMIIDVTRTKEELLAQVKEYLDGYQQLLPKRHNRRKATTVIDIWHVYDQSQKGVEVKVHQIYFLKN